MPIPATAPTGPNSIEPIIPDKVAPRAAADTIAEDLNFILSFFNI